MADQEDEELKMALRLSMQQDSPEPKRSKPGEGVSGAADGGVGVEGESPEARNRRMQRELMAAAAEKRMLAAKKAAAERGVMEGKSSGSSCTISTDSKDKKVNSTTDGRSVSLGRELSAVEVQKVHLGKSDDKSVNLGTKLSEVEAHRLFLMIFGNEVTKDILAQWSNQGIRFSPDPETLMGLVQHEGGPCGVLAAIQASVLKYLLFCPEERGSAASLGSRKLTISGCVAADIFPSLTEDKRSRALVRSMSEILYLCGSNQRSVVASLSILDGCAEESQENYKDEAIAKLLEGLSIESWSDLHKFLRVNTYTSQASSYHGLEDMLPVFRSRMGAMLFLISALLSRGLDSVQADRDDPSQPLVTAPFGHASQEIVNLLLSGKAVANVFDGKMDLGGGMFVNGVSTNVEVGFLTLLESLNYCKVGHLLKCPKWPIWVIGSESHYTVLFALDTEVQEENELESREMQIRKAFDAKDQSGGGGFIGVEGFHQVLHETGITLSAEKLEHLCNTGFIVWSEFWQVLLDLERSLGGLKDTSGQMGKKVFDLYHFNGIAKSVMNGSQGFPGGENPTQRPRLTKLKVSVPPKWTPEGYIADVAAASSISLNADSRNKDTAGEVSKPEPVQRAPLVDCIRTRWPRAVCTWEGDPPSIV